MILQPSTPPSAEWPPEGHIGKQPRTALQISASRSGAVRSTWRGHAYSRARAARRALREKSSRRAVSSNSSLIFATKPRISPGSTRKPNSPSSTTLGMPWVALATGGTPQGNLHPFIPPPRPKAANVHDPVPGRLVRPGHKEARVNSRADNGRLLDVGRYQRAALHEGRTANDPARPAQSARQDQGFVAANERVRPGIPFYHAVMVVGNDERYLLCLASRNIYHAGNRSMSHDNIGALPRDNTPERPAPADPERRIGNLQPIREMIYLQSLVASCGSPVAAAGRDHCDLPVLGVLQTFRYLVGVLFQAPAARLEIRGSDQ